jgi:threonine dehydrogenase-like Zn-dependent dehydrogenase
MTDVGPIKSGSVTDEYALFLSDIFPTGYMAAVNAPVQRGDTVAIWAEVQSDSSRNGRRRDRRL